MPFLLNKEEFNKSAYVKENRHKPGKTIRVFPFSTKAENMSKFSYDLKSFKGIVGGAIRESLGKKIKGDFKKEHLINLVCSGVTTEHSETLSDIISKVCFDDYGNFHSFNKAILPYQTIKTSNATLNQISSYVAKVFLNDLENTFTQNNTGKSNILVGLLLDNLPELEDSLDSSNQHFCSKELNKILEQFRNDFKILSEDESLFVKNIDLFLKYYFFLYVSRLTFILNSFINKQNEPTLFFSVEWEALSSSRIATYNGWNLLAESIKDMFVHSNCLELLNYLEGVSDNCFIYDELNESYNKQSKVDRIYSIKEIENLIHLYQNSITDIQWEDFSTNDEDQELEPSIAPTIRKLFYSIKYQAEKSSRHAPFKKYFKWFEEFSKLNFLKYRGCLGYTLSINQETLLFFTRLAIGNRLEKKIRLIDYWSAMEVRGFYFDRYTRSHIVELFEKINLLEKKSDSGDAQFIKLEDTV